MNKENCALKFVDEIILKGICQNLWSRVPVKVPLSLHAKSGKRVTTDMD